MITRNYRFYIGIDCGVETGIAIWWKEKKEFSTLSTMKIHEAMKHIENILKNNPGAVVIRVEDARLRTWIPRMKEESRERGRREGAGSVKRDAKIWEDFLTSIGAEFEMVAPKNNKTKVTAEYFKKLTGHKGSTSSHARDAGMLVFGY